GAVLSALHAAFLHGANTVVTLACDLPAVDAAAVRGLLEAAPALHSAPAVIIATENGRRAHPNGVWQTRLLPALESRFVDEANSVRDLIGDTPVIEVDGGGSFADADDPETLDGFR
ncbi:MAG: NTP transferase domain-containing protein, partial [Actinobacteria bacterium]|nr:NTP transferase domain-containing protein [Actinomycetota bacterium]